MHSPNGRPAIFSMASVMLCTGSVRSTTDAAGTAAVAAVATSAPLAALPDGDADPDSVHRAVLLAASDVGVVAFGLAVSRCVTSPDWLQLLDVLLAGVPIVVVAVEVLVVTFAAAMLFTWLLRLLLGTAAAGAIAGTEPAVPKSPTGRTRYCCKSTTCGVGEELIRNVVICFPFEDRFIGHIMLVRRQTVEFVTLDTFCPF